MNRRHLGFALSLVILGGCGDAAPATPPATEAAVVPAASPTIASTPSPEPTAAPTQAAGSTPSPSPRPTLTSIAKKLLADKRSSVKPAAVIAAMKAAYAAVPARSFVDPRDDLLRPDDLIRNFRRCQKGDPTSQGDPDGNRAVMCHSVVGGLVLRYQISGIKAYYDAALAAYNYAYHAPSRDWAKGNIDDLLLEMARAMDMANGG